MRRLKFLWWRMRRQWRCRLHSCPCLPEWDRGELWATCSDCGEKRVYLTNDRELERLLP